MNEMWQLVALWIGLLIATLVGGVFILSIVTLFV